MSDNPFTFHPAPSAGAQLLLEGLQWQAVEWPINKPGEGAHLYRGHVHPNDRLAKRDVIHATPHLSEALRPRSRKGENGLPRNVRYLTVYECLPSQRFTDDETAEYEGLVAGVAVQPGEPFDRYKHFETTLEEGNRIVGRYLVRWKGRTNAVQQGAPIPSSDDYDDFQIASLDERTYQSLLELADCDPAKTSWGPAEMAR